MWQKGEKEVALGVSTEQKYRYKKGGGKEAKRREKVIKGG